MATFGASTQLNEELDQLVGNIDALKQRMKVWNEDKTAGAPLLPGANLKHSCLCREQDGKLTQVVKSTAEQRTLMDQLKLTNDTIVVLRALCKVGSDSGSASFLIPGTIDTDPFPFPRPTTFSGRSTRMWMAASWTGQHAPASRRSERL
jgi:hypothetical protein